MLETRIAMWSGPRNISTAMMRSFENRPDTQVVDEPFYACYLAQTQSPHPGFDEVLASQPNKFDQVVNQLTEEPISTRLQYQKHMTHHMPESIDLNWSSNLSHCFLIRDPAQIICSYDKVRGECTLEDIGIKRQYQLYQEITALTGQDIPIIDSNDVLKNPEKMLSALCEMLSIPFYQEMLSWPAGKRDSDGVWAKYWYSAVESSTGFKPYSETKTELTARQQTIANQASDYFESLYAKRIKP